MVTFTEEILNGKLHFLCSVGSEYAFGINKLCFDLKSNLVKNIQINIS